MIFKFKIERVAPVSKTVCLWNTWDHEHLYFVHRQFNEAKILFENKTTAVINTKVKIPFTPFFMSNLHCLYEFEDKNVLVIDTLPFGVIAKVRMEYEEIEEKQTRLTNYYEINLPFYFVPFFLILKAMILRWDDINWEGDLPLKIRRQQAVDLGFRDFVGIDHRLKGKHKFILPLARTPNSIIESAKANAS